MKKYGKKKVKVARVANPAAKAKRAAGGATRSKYGGRVKKRRRR